MEQSTLLSGSLFLSVCQLSGRESNSDQQKTWSKAFLSFSLSFLFSLSVNFQANVLSLSFYLLLVHSQKTGCQLSFQCPSLSNLLSLAGPSICPLTEPEKPDLGGIDTHSHCFAAWYITLQNHTCVYLKLPPIFPILTRLATTPPQTPYSHFVRK